MPKFKTILARLSAGFLIAAVCLVGLVDWPAGAVAPADLMTGSLSLKLTDTVGYVDDYRQQQADCQTITVTIAGSGQEIMTCPRPTAFGWLSDSGVIRFNGNSIYRQIKLPPGVSLLPQPDSDIVFVVDQKTVFGPDITLRYYEHFTDHLTVSPDNHQLVLDDLVSSLTIETFDYSVIRQPDIVGNLKSGRVLLAYDGRLAWADLNNRASGVLQNLPMRNGAHILPSLALSPNGRMVAASYPSFDLYGPDYTLSLWDIDNCAASTGVCQRPLLGYLREQLPDLYSVGYMRFVDNATLEMVTGLNHGGRYPIYWLSGGPPQASVDYLALGDSFAAGEGAYSYRDGTETATNKCHNSLVAYPYLLNDAAISVACSGAVTDDVNGVAAAQRTGRRDSDYNFDQLVQLQAAALPGTLNQLSFASYFKPELATVSIGGNDIGFADILKACIDPRGNWQVRATCYATYEDRLELLNQIRGQYGNLVSVYQQLLHYSRRLYVIGYPQIITATGSCGVNVLLNSTERVFAVQLTDYLNSVIKAAADTAGAVYVDVSQALAGRKLCESSSPAVNGLTDDQEFLPWLGQESFHPNWLGHQLLAQTIRRLTAGFTTQANHAPTQPPAITSDLPILKVPKSDRLLNAVQYNGQLLADVIERSVPLLIRLLPGPESFAPSSEVKLVLHSSPVTVGAYQTDAAGGLDVQFIWPPALPNGYHSVKLLGHNRYGEPLEITKTVYITGDEPAALAGTLGLGVAVARAGLVSNSQTAMTPSVVR